ncbi:MAG: preprotein translocase subunit SecE [Proteobacteria bacterium]|nr:preprotein translocase subunit SecE [Pseudomonadota bacterium]MBU1710080.1 preprotein translocase subunit SecE [Pseudomonadota bacterium]
MSIKKLEKKPVKVKKQVVKPQEDAKNFSVSTIRDFLTDVKSEWGKVAWPDKKHTMGSTVVVVILVMLISFYLGAVDLLLGKMVEFILR